jgi:hypothetical protein
MGCNIAAGMPARPNITNEELEVLHPTSGKELVKPCLSMSLTLEIAQ